MISCLLSQNPLVIDTLCWFSSGSLPDSLAEETDIIATPYATGVPMGGTVTDSAKQMKIFVAASRDPLSAPLQRVQIIKDWVEISETMETVIDITCGDDQSPIGGRSPDNGARVDLSNCAYSEDTGSAELATIWQDPNFEPDQPAFYYAHALMLPR